ncbi:hypothetical protein FACS189430_03570 [Bacteroidia bacterium]|nr:hypothetical protein FACS189430_03570 [Bacteroidia bacterium]
MKNNTLFFLSFLLLFTSGCHTKKSAPVSARATLIVDITSNEEMRLSDYFDNFHMVKLSTDNDHLIGEIQKIQLTNHKIFISDGRSMFVFSETGDFLSGFNHVGNGPGEYQKITDFTIVGEDIVVLSRSQRKLLKYNSSGKCTSEKRLNYWAMKVSSSIDGAFMIYCGNEQGYENQFKLHLTKDSQTVEQFLPVNSVQAKYLHVSAPSNFFKYKNTVSFFEMFNDTVYTLVNGNIERKYYIDYQGKNIPSSFFDNDYANIIDFFQAIHKTSFAYGIDKFAENDKMIMFGSIYKKTNKISIVDVHNKTSHPFATIKDDIYFDSLIIPAEEFNYFADSSIIFPVDAPTIMEWRNKYQPAEKYTKAVNDTQEDDNPVLLIFDFKQ